MEPLLFCLLGVILIIYNRIKLFWGLFQNWFWSHLSVGIFLIAAIFWDIWYALGSIVAAHSASLPRHTRRYSNRIHSFKRYSRWWMILFSIMIHYYWLLHPAAHVSTSISTTTMYMYWLNKFVCVSHDVWWQLSLLKGIEIINIFQRLFLSLFMIH